MCLNIAFFDEKSVPFDSVPRLGLQVWLSSATMAGFTAWASWALWLVELSIFLYELRPLSCMVSFIDPDFNEELPNEECETSSPSARAFPWWPTAWISSFFSPKIVVDEGWDHSMRSCCVSALGSSVPFEELLSPLPVEEFYIAVVPVPLLSEPGGLLKLLGCIFLCSSSSALLWSLWAWSNSPTSKLISSAPIPFKSTMTDAEAELCPLLKEQSESLNSLSLLRSKFGTGEIGFLWL